MTKPTRVAIGLSGGVDSAVAAYLLKQQGYEVIGLHLKLHDSIDPLHTRACCSLDSSLDARMVAHQLDIPYYVINQTEEFQKWVINPFIREYQAGRTPNPCIECNKYIKFGSFIDKAMQLGCEKLATGHYATIYKEAGRYRMKQAKAVQKDQTYMLYSLSQEQLAHMLMPLGAMEDKQQVRQIAEDLGLAVASIQDSQDICFVPDDDHLAFLESELGALKPGDFVLDGQVIGQHRGIEHYTIGQRKGLGISYSEPLFVIAIDAAKRQVQLGRADDVYGRALCGSRLNLIYEELPAGSEKLLQAKVRYSQHSIPARLQIGEGGMFEVHFDEPVRAISPGQSVVLYLGDDLYGGGIIDRKIM